MNRRRLFKSQRCYIIFHSFIGQALLDAASQYSHAYRVAALWKGAHREGSL